MQYHISTNSKNAKTGIRIVTTSSADTCPPSCSFISKGCYAKAGPLALHWKKVSTGNRGGDLATFTDTLARNLYPTELWRHNQAGDLPGLGEDIDTDALEAIRKASAKAGAVGYTYSHKKSPKALATIQENNKKPGLFVNISCDTLAECDKPELSGFPLTVVVSQDTPKVSTTPKGQKVVICPNQTVNLTCAECKLCAKPRDYIIGFRAHGSSKKHVENIIKLADLK